MAVADPNDQAARLQLGQGCTDAVPVEPVVLPCGFDADKRIADREGAQGDDDAVRLANSNF